MNCPSCQRSNDPRRHYCGGCGANIAPVCRRCEFVNDIEDRYCGGCGDAMMATGTSVVARPAAERLTLVPPVTAPRATTPPPTRAAVAPAPPPAPPAGPPHAPVPPVTTEIASVTPRRSDMITADDLAELLAQASAAATPQVSLPDGQVNQDDLDKLFGAF